MGYSGGILVGHGAVLALSRHSRCSSTWAIISLPLFVTQEETFPNRVAGTVGPFWDCLVQLPPRLQFQLMLWLQLWFGQEALLRDAKIAAHACPCYWLSLTWQNYAQRSTFNFRSNEGHLSRLVWWPDDENNKGNVRHCNTPAEFLWLPLVLAW